MGEVPESYDSRFQPRKLEEPPSILWAPKGTDKYLLKDDGSIVTTVVIVYVP